MSVAARLATSPPDPNHSSGAVPPPDGADQVPAVVPDQRTSQDRALRRLESPRLAGRRVLITGARGFIGARLARRLVATGAHVHATTRGRAAHDEAMKWWHCDLADADATRRLVDHIRPEVILHLASRVQGTRDPDLALPMIDDNLRAAVALMRAAVTIGSCRVVLAGSIEEPRNPDDPATSPYTAAKAAATAQARLFHHQWDLPVTVLRIAMVYGPGQPDTTKLVPYVIAGLLRGQTPQLSSGARQVDWVYVDDVVDAFLAAATHPAAPGHVIDVGSGCAMSIAETATLIADLTGTDVALGFGQAGDRRHDLDWVADPEPAATALGWRAQTPLVDGLRRTIASYAEAARTRRWVG